MQTTGQRQGAVAGVVELGDLVLVRSTHETPSAWSRLEGLEAPMGAARRHGVGAVRQRPDLVDDEARQDTTPPTRSPDRPRTMR